jgi:hypothetical protein
MGVDLAGLKNGYYLVLWGTLPTPFPNADRARHRCEHPDEPTEGSVPVDRRSDRSRHTQRTVPDRSIQGPSVASSERMSAGSAFQSATTASVRESAGTVQLHAAPTIGPVLAAVLTVASVASAALVGLALAALVRRRTSPYLFVALAVAALAARSVVGWLGMVGRLSTGTHHLAEHALDVVMVALVVAAVYYARAVRPQTTPEQP